ncbi:hypothetical protein FQA39_LY08268 [Lamprigera yunnana]|nr:hypothetical protein FQA39_LY08268 [Lamprigera yunnana]
MYISKEPQENNVTVLFVVKSKCTSTKYVSYNSTDLSYLSNGIQIPVLSSGEDDPIIDEMVQTIPDMQWLSQLYNHHMWIKRISVVENSECRSHLSIYIGHLQNNSLWAIKMHDASGRYSGQFLFGNDYWLGSHTLCKELEHLEDGSEEVPPFSVYFYVAIIRLNVNPNVTPVTRQINVGQCLPRSCTVTDIRRLLKQERSQGSKLSVIGVRAVPGDYSLLYDLKFHIIAGIGSFVAVLLLIGTTFDYFSKKKCNESVTQNKESKDLELPTDLTKCEKRNNGSKSEKYKQLLICFSALKNGSKVLNMDYQNKDSITCLHGLRFFSITWIILVHSYLEVFAIADNKSLRTVTERSFFYQTISNGTFSVDTFFFISGFLLTITYLKREWSKEKKNDKKETLQTGIKISIGKYFTLLFYRYIRLTPAYLFILGVNEVVMRYYQNSTVFTPAMIDHVTCPQYWWRNALYINNLFPVTEFCMLWSWYMSNDMQFFALSVVLLIIAVRNDKCFKWVVGVVVVFLLSSWIVVFLMAMEYKYVARIEEPFALFDELYDKPWLRIGPYLIGMATAYVLLKLNYKLVLPKIVVLLAWIVSLGGLLCLVYGLGREGLVVPLSAVYASLGHTAWALCIAWIVVACSTDNGGPINALLSFRGIFPLSRLSYCAYLVHPVIMYAISFELDGPFHLNQCFMIIVHFGNMVLSFIVAFIVSIAFEAPFVSLLKVFPSR